MGLQLNKEADALGATARSSRSAGKEVAEMTPAAPQVIRSRWMG
jgi:hypothetical protein